MALTSGTKLGPYEIQSPLGAGGMGEVYRARDTRLDRTVAIKVLSSALVASSDLKARFEREARTLSGVSHPNICSIYDVGQQDGADYLVLEYLEGETLERRITRGMLPWMDVLEYGIMIAAGLEAAHRHGIVHRDLKPSNIMLTKSGVKLMDFGLAKFTALAAPIAVWMSQSQSTQNNITEPGVIVGTFQYMSPEQLEGKEPDARTDIFALGEVLYEMATGHTPFTGQTRTSLIASILSSDPLPIVQFRPMSPPALERLVRTCLAKDPDERRQTAHDVLLDLKWISEGASQAIPPPLPARRRATPLLIAVAAVLIFAIGLGVARWLSIDHPSHGVPVSFTVMLPSGAQAATGLSPTIAISPDATHLAFVVTEADHTQLYLRAMNEVDSTPIPGSEGADGVFFSPDGRWVGFFADHKLKKAAIDGGAAVTLCDAGAPLGASWGPDDVIVFAAVPDAGLSRVSATGGVPQVLTAPNFAKGESNYFWPEILPDGNAVLYTTLNNSGKSRIDVWNLRTSEHRTLVDEAMNARYSAGYLVFSRAGALFAVPFDVEHVQVTGAAVLVLDSVAPTAIGAAQFTLSREGTLVYLSGASPDIDRALVWVNRAGAARPLPAPHRAYQDPRLAPDGKRLVVEIYPGMNGDLWTYELDRGTLSRITFEGHENETPVWMPDSTRVAFSSSRAGVQRALFWKAITQSDGDQEIVVRNHHVHLSSASADGQFLAFTEYDPVTQGDIWVLPLTGVRQARPFLQTPFHEWGAVFSPDSHWLAYVSNESGRDEIYVQAFPGPGQKRQISTEGGKEPVWAREDRELFYRNGRKMMAVSITTEPTFSVGKPHQLFEGPYDSGLPLGHTNYDVSPDGQRLVMIQTRQQESTARRVDVRQNWVQGIQHRVPRAR